MYPLQQTIKQAALPVTFIWIGFVSAISFMEAWLKFRAPGITLPLGLGIGSLVFKALNLMEWLFALLIAARFILNRRRERRSSVTQYGGIMILLLIQTLWLLPALDARIPLYQQGLEVPSSPLHIYYVVAELFKVTLLIIVGIGFLKEAR
jgi:hypothetical protein